MIGFKSHHNIKQVNEIIKFEMNIYDTCVINLALEFKISIQEVRQMPVNHFFALFYKMQQESINKAWQQKEEYEQLKIKK